MTNLLKLSLAVWYAAYAPTSTHGPFGVFTKARETLPHGGLLDCPVCLSFWAAALLVLLKPKRLISILAAAGGAMFVHSFGGWRYGG